MKKYFITGLVILLPLAVTITVAAFFINLLTDPFVGFIEHFLKPLSWYPTYAAAIHILLQILLLIFLFFFTVFLGILGRLLFFKSFLTVYDYLMHRIPVIKTVYKASQQVIKGIFSSNARSFKQVVLVSFPVKGSYAIGLVPSSAPTICEKALNTPLVTVFVPTTPNPTSGYLMLYRPEEVIYLDMKTEDAVKYIISCGVVTSDHPEGMGMRVEIPEV